MKKIYVLQIIDAFLMPLDDPTIEVGVHVDDLETNDDGETVDDDGFEITGH